MTPHKEVISIMENQPHIMNDAYMSNANANKSSPSLEWCSKGSATVFGCYIANKILAAVIK